MISCPFCNRPLRKQDGFIDEFFCFMCKDHQNYPKFVCKINKDKLLYFLFAEIDLNNQEYKIYSYGRPELPNKTQIFKGSNKLVEIKQFINLTSDQLTIPNIKNQIQKLLNLAILQ